MPMRAHVASPPAGLMLPPVPSTMLPPAAPLPVAPLPVAPEPSSPAPLPLALHAVIAQAPEPKSTNAAHQACHPDEECRDMDRRHKCSLNFRLAERGRDLARGGRRR